MECGADIRCDADLGAWVSDARTRRNGNPHFLFDGERIDGSTDRRIDGSMDRWIDGAMDRQKRNKKAGPEGPQENSTFRGSGCRRCATKLMRAEKWWGWR